MNSLRRCFCGHQANTDVSGGGVENFRQELSVQSGRPSTLVATGVVSVTLTGPCHLGTRGEGGIKGRELGLQVVERSRGVEVKEVGTAYNQ